LKTQKDKWLFFLKNLENFDDIPAILREPVFEKAFSEAEYFKYPPALQEQYQRDLMAYRDNVNVLETARIEGIGEGKAKRSAEVARNMKAEGLSAALISKITGLSGADIERL
jgi:predicted transposase/invertase (TIGR01784 family)